MSQQIVNQVDAQYPHLLRANTHESGAHFSYRVVEALGPAKPGQAGWVLLGKNHGGNGHRWENGVITSHDAIFRVDASGRKLEGKDVVVAGGTGRPTHPGWGDIPPVLNGVKNWRDQDEVIYLSQVPEPGGALPVPDPTPTPTPTPDPPPTGPICPDRSAHQPLPPVDPLRWIGDSDLLAIADEFVARGRRDDVGGMVDAGSQFGRRIQARYSREQALKETRDWISFWYGPRP